MGYTHHPFIEPTHDIFQPLDPVPRFPRARQLVRLAWKHDHRSWAFHIFQRPEQLLTARILRSPIIRLSQHEEGRSVNIFYKSDRRAIVVVLRILKRWRFEPFWLEEGEI